MLVVYAPTTNFKEEEEEKEEDLEEEEGEGGKRKKKETKPSNIERHCDLHLARSAENKIVCVYVCVCVCVPAMCVCVYMLHITTNNMISILLTKHL